MTKNTMTPAPRNRTLSLTESDRVRYRGRLTALGAAARPEDLIDRVVHQDLFEALPLLPPGFADLIFIDPPYNLTKSFGGRTFRQTTTARYRDWLESWLPAIVQALKPEGSLYLCGDWRSAAAIQETGEKYLCLRNRITFEREKGRGSRRNWKNAHEDVWFFTRGRDYFFNPDAVKLKRQVIAPYRENGQPKGWAPGPDGNYRLTHASNLWTDLSMPFWSMPENTPHPTQKPEKLLAKIILASTRPGDLVLDPFAGSGAAGVAARKLGRRFTLIECDEEYCLYALKRLDLAGLAPRIQGFTDGVFWERNTGRQARRAEKAGE